MLTYTDTHCHLDFNRYENDRHKVLKRAWEAGLVWILNPGIDLHTNLAALTLAKLHPHKISAGVGIHPNFGQPWTADILPALREQAQNQVVVAIGEIGLDYYRQHTPYDQQQFMFKEQLNLAAELGLPVIIHNRNATNDLMKILTEWHQSLSQSGHPLAKRPGVLHSYSADYDTAMNAIKMNFYIGISGPVTFKNASDRKQITQKLPLDRLLLETDAPFLTPHPHRGKRNEPGYIPLIAKEVARLHQTSGEEIARRTHENAQNLFKFNKGSMEHIIKSCVTT